ncbi:hypothetical protein PROFUN_14674, partial [Planoprotostelium fungivorum]
HLTTLNPKPPPPRIVSSYTKTSLLGFLRLYVNSLIDANRLHKRLLDLTPVVDFFITSELKCATQSQRHSNSTWIDEADSGEYFCTSCLFNFIAAVTIPLPTVHSAQTSPPTLCGDANTMIITQGRLTVDSGTTTADIHRISSMEMYILPNPCIMLSVIYNSGYGAINTASTSLNSLDYRYNSFIINLAPIRFQTLNFALVSIKPVACRARTLCCAPPSSRKTRDLFSTLSIFPDYNLVFKIVVN